MMPGTQNGQGYHYEVTACGMKIKQIGAFLKHFEPDCFLAEGVCF